MRLPITLLAFLVCAATLIAAEPPEGSPPNRRLDPDPREGVNVEDLYRDFVSYVKDCTF